MSGDPLFAALAVQELLAGAGLTAGLKAPARWPKAGFVKVIMLTAAPEVEAGVTVSQPLEVEAWHPDPVGALRLAGKALDTILGAEGTRVADGTGVAGRDLEVRRARVEAHVGELPTGEAGWERYRFTVALTFRQVRERIG